MIIEQVFQKKDKKCFLHFLYDYVLSPIISKPLKTGVSSVLRNALIPLNGSRI